jgi:transcriptional regulator with XRE-family HTH domain
MEDIFVTHNKKRLGEQLKNYRTKNGNRKHPEYIGLDRFAAMTGLTKSQILAIEQARKNYTIDSLLKYLKVINRPLDEVLKMIF